MEGKAKEKGYEKEAHGGSKREEGIMVRARV